MKSKINKIYIFIAALAFVVFSSFRTDYFEISKQLDIFATLFKELNIYYVDDTDPDELMHEAIKSMLATLDPYTTFMTEDEAENFQIHTLGEYAGIGASIRVINKKIVVAQVYEGFAADKAGIKAGDVFVEIDGKKINDQNSSEISSTLKGSVNSQVEIMYKRIGNDKPITVRFPREKIIVKAVPFSVMVNEKVGYISLNSFSRKASKEVATAFTDLKSEGMQYLIFDLRGNPGGLLSQAVEISGLFLPRKTFVVETKGKIQEWNKKYTTKHRPKDTKIPIVVLTDFGTASASEIVAGSLQDLDRAVIMGSRTYGKGLVQQPRSLSYGTKLKITIAKYYTPSGRCIQSKDYFHKDENGNPIVTPDSLRTKFTTKGGRTVFDGAGIEPDVKIEDEELSNLIVSLIDQNILFNYSVEYCNKTEGKVELSSFEISEKDLEDFESYTNNKNFVYETELSNKLSEFKDIAVKENMIPELGKTISQLEEKLKKGNHNKFKNNSDNIKKILELSIINNDYHQRGRYMYNIKNDELIIKATNLLQDEITYKELLTLNNK
ncbi:MAG: S41 family peptidase [Flavobacteriales bacterium]|nr:S41 family peptidase [Flavobacteriales bacterium]